MAARAIRVTINTKDGSEHSFGIGLEDFKEETLHFDLQFFFRKALQTLELDDMRLDITKRPPRGSFGEFK